MAWEVERYERSGHTRWQPHVTHDLTPLTTQGNRGDYGNPWAIKSPDGKFDVCGNILNEAEAIQELKDQAAAETKSA